MDNNMVDDLAEWLNSDEAKLEFNKYRKTQDIYSAQRDRYMGLWKTLTKTQRTNIMRKLSVFKYHSDKYINIMRVIYDITQETNMFQACDFIHKDEEEIIYDIDGIALYHSLYDLSKITMLNATDIIPHIRYVNVINIYYPDGKLLWYGDNSATQEDICNQIISKHLTGYMIANSNESYKKYEINKNN